MKTLRLGKSGLGWELMLFHQCLLPGTANDVTSNCVRF